MKIPIQILNIVENVTTSKLIQVLIHHELTTCMLTHNIFMLLSGASFTTMN